MRPEIVIIGAGYAGVSAAKRLDRAGLACTLIGPRDEFVERIRLHQLLAGNHPATTPLADLLPARTSHVRGTAVAIDVARRVVALRDGGEVGYDYLIYAVGSHSGLDVIAGAAEHAVTVGDLDGAVLARERLDRLPADASITVVGGGLTGIEVAAELAEQGEHAVRLVTDGRIAETVGAKGRAYIRDVLTGLGVRVLEATPVEEIQEGKVVLADGRALDSDLSVLTATLRMPALAADSGLATSADGALSVHPTLVSTSAPEIVGAGDAAAVAGRPVRMSCQSACPLGMHAAETVLHLADGTEPKPVSPKFVSQCISLGRRSGLLQHTRFDDTPTALTVTGKLGARFKERICASTTGIALNPRTKWFRVSWN
ncbi:FAD-dependent oxidoreductase [Saccharopolyspora halophila]|uniref:FAD-dependent oxidoreductase n=1 Tax=Saccharopolyspora halophila TaxID=405551 RepID=A0ABP5T7T1_9PSEU